MNQSLKVAVPTMRWRQYFCAITALACLLSIWGVGAHAKPVVQVLHNSFVSAEKFHQLQAIAQQEGVVLQHTNVEHNTPEAIGKAVDQATLLLLDGPRPSDRSAVEQAAPSLSRAARLTVGGGRPAWLGMPDDVGRALAAHYSAGGQQGYQRFFALVNVWHQGKKPLAPLLVASTVLPATGFYHPDAAETFTRAADYLAWHAATQSLAVRGKVAFLISRSVLSDLLTRNVDTLIRRSEAAGLLPLVFWTNESLADVLAEATVDVLVNLTHMQGAVARSQDFLALDVPVLQTLNFRAGEAADWPDAPSGVTARTTAVFLAAPEGWGISDPLVLSAATKGVNALLPEQADALLAKLQALVTLRHTPTADKRLALMFWNYPAGEKNLGASNLNLPRSIVSIQAALSAQGYAVGAVAGEQAVIQAGQRMLGALYGTVSLEQLLAEDLAALYPLADYERWLAALPVQRRQALLATGTPAQHRAVRVVDGQHYFVIPRWQLGHLLVMPQMPRRMESTADARSYHDTGSAPDHLYMAAYLYVQQGHAAHALIHLGTHGTQEWLPGKDRGLAVSDYPWLAVGSLPVFYPYIQDNVGEAIQAKRRGRAVTISHQTPPFAPTGLYDQLRDLHHLIHEYQQLDEGQVREQVAMRIRQAAIAAHMHDDLGWSAELAEGDFPAFLQVLHDHLHELARTAMPLGLHTFGQPASMEHRISTIMQQLGAPFYDALDVAQVDIYAQDWQALHGSRLWRSVQELLESEADKPLPAAVRTFAAQAREYDQRLRDTQENESLLAALAGRFVRPGAGGDPIRSPDVASGRNLYAFEADKIPARAAYDSAASAYAQLVAAFRAEHGGEWPRKLAFSLWSSEAIRHLGVTEAQILHALGLQPVWDAGGRVTALDIIPSSKLGRPRSDVVIHVTGVYRDQFDSFMRLLDEAMQRLTALEEPDNPLAVNNQRIASTLEQQGMTKQEAAQAARYRIFSNAPGHYGTGVPRLALHSTTWDDDAELGKRFLASGRYAYGGDQKAGNWGQAAGQANLLAEQLRGTQMAIMSRSSNLHGVLSTDHPFEFLGGISAAVRHLDGKAPQLLISDLRDPRHIKTTGLARFLADEMRARYLNPQWIEAMQQQGYAGTLEVLNVSNNLFGWQAVDPNVVRADQWQALFDTYVSDIRALGTVEWFEQHNPTAQAQMLERMAEAIRKGYWDASEATRRTLAQRWQELAQRFEVDTGAPMTRRYLEDMAAGFGLHAEAAQEAMASVEAPETGAIPAENRVQGQIMNPVELSSIADSHTAQWALALILLAIGCGAVWQLIVMRQSLLQVEGKL